MLRERKGKEVVLRESEERFRLFVDSAPAMIWTSGIDRLCTFCNRGWLKFTGRTMEQERGDGWTAGVCPDDHERCYSTYSSPSMSAGHSKWSTGCTGQMGNTPGCSIRAFHASPPTGFSPATSAPALTSRI